MIYTKVHMDEDIAHAIDLPPWHLRMLLFKFLWNSSCCFSNNFEVTKHPILYQLILIEGLTPLVSIFLNEFNCFLIYLADAYVVLS